MLAGAVLALPLLGRAGFGGLNKVFGSAIEKSGPLSTATIVMGLVAFLSIWAVAAVVL
ncbi:MAG: hypothetical protein LBK60_07225 [Verrucomicrobiales bacterium]|nr:hypothetical protein [Verrucomicrobiales bacterium]